LAFVLAGYSRTLWKPKLYNQPDLAVELFLPVLSHSWLPVFSLSVLQRLTAELETSEAGPAIGRDNMLFDDDWLMIVNKPRGLYCEHVFATVPSLTIPHLCKHL
jgi:23S rRNA-/tRNA-specific pseudouridylate synthase